MVRLDRVIWREFCQGTTNKDMGRSERNWAGWCSVLEPATMGSCYHPRPEDGEVEGTWTQGRRDMRTGCLQEL